MKRVLSLFLSLAVVVAMFPATSITVNAGEITAVIIETGENCTTVQQAINNAASGQTVKILKDSDVNVTISNNDNITLDLNGYVLNSASDGNPVIAVETNAQLTIIDSNAEKEHKFTVPEGKTGLWTLDETSGTEVINGGIITGGNNDENGGGISNKGTLILNGGAVVGNKTSSGNNGTGGGIYNLGKLTINEGALVIGNTAIGNGGGVSNKGASFIMNGGKIAYNISSNGSNSGAGGGVYNETNFDMYGGEISGNKCGSSIGGGVDNTTFSSYSMVLGKTAVIKNNTASNGTNNLYNESNSYVTIATGENAPQEGKMDIGVTLDSGTGKVTTANSEDFTEYFHSDNSDYGIYNKVDGNDNYVYVGNLVKMYEKGADPSTATIYDSITKALMDASDKSFSGAIIQMLTDSSENLNTGEYDLNCKDITLDLNGHVLKSKTSGYSVIDVCSDLTLTITDSNPDAVHSGDYASLPNGGVITGSKWKQAAPKGFKGGTGITNSGTLNLYGGTITGNVGASYGGVYNSGSMTIGGTAKITGNTLKGGSVSNLYLPDTVTVSLGTDENAPAKGMDISVTTQTAPESGLPVKITNSSETNYSSYFKSDISGYTAKYNSEKCIELSVKLPTVAMIGEAEYETVQDAVNAAISGQTVKMVSDSKEDVTVAADDNITLDLNGFVLSGTGSSSVITNNGILNIISSDTTKAHYFDCKSKKAWELNSEAESGTELSSLTGDIQSTTVIKLTGGIITGANHDSNGGGIYTTGSKLTLNSNVNIVGNTAKYGGGVCSNSDESGDTVVLNGANIVGNLARLSTEYNSKGGGIYATDGDGVCINSGVIAYNTAFSGGALCNGSFTIKGGEIRNNTGTYTPTPASFVYNYSGTLLVSGGYIDGTKFISDSAKLTGGYYTQTAKDSLADFVDTDNNYYFVANEDTKTKDIYPWKVEKAVAVIKDDSSKVGYSSVSKAITAAGTTASTITMLSDSKEYISIATDQDITLDLNGHALKGTGTYNVISVYGSLKVKDSANSNLHYFTYSKTGAWTYIENPTTEQKDSAVSIDEITDSTEVVKISGGVITGGKTSSNGGGIFVYGSGELKMTGGTICGNSAKDGGGIYTGNTVTITLEDVTIAGNHASDSFGGAILNTKYSNLTFGGTVKIFKNTLGSGTVTEDNLTLWDVTSGTPPITIDADNPLKEGSNIYLCLKNHSGNYISNVITNANSADYSKCFKSDNADYEIINTGKGNEQKVKILKHEHSWKYTADKATITAVCEGEGTCSLKDTSLTIAKPANLTYSGESKQATFGDAKTFIGGNLPEITYEYKASEEGEYTSTTDTKKAGYYKASFTAGEETAYVEYEVEKAELNVTGTTADGKTYDGTKAAVVKAGSLSGVVEGDKVEIDTAVGTFSSKDTGNGIDVTITYTLKGDDASNYTVKDSTSVADIGKRSVTLTSASPNKSYDGTELKDDTVTVSGDGWASGEGASYTVTGSQTKAGQSSNTFTYTLNEGTSEGNYSITTTYGTLTVSPLQLAITGTTVDEKIFDGTTDASAKPGTVTGIVGSDDVKVEVESAAFENKNAGESKTATVSYKLTGNDASNYTAPNTENISSKITPKEIKVTADNKESYVGSELEDLTYKVDENTSLCGSDSFEGKLETDADKDRVKAYDILIGSLKVNDGNSGKNYSITYTKGTYNVTDKLNQNLSFTNVTAGSVIKTYGDDKFTETLSGAKTNVTYSSSDESVATVDSKGEITILKAGEAVITATAQSTAMYNQASAQFTLTVNKAKVDVPEAVTGLEYTGEEQTGVVLPDNAKYTLTGNTGTNAKEDYEATAALTDKTNYEWNLDTPTSEDQEITWSIAKKQLTVSDSKKTKATSRPYDGTCAAGARVGTVIGIADTDADNVTVKASGEFEDKNAGENKEVKVTYSLEGNAKDNYIAPVSDTCTATIHQLEIQVIDVEVEDKFYDGTSDAVIKEIGNINLKNSNIKKVVEADDVELDTATGQFQNINVGYRGVIVSYTLKGKDAANYIVTDTKKYANIYKAKVDVPEAVTGLVYNGQEQTGVVLPEDAKYTLTGNTGTNAKEEYEATATLTDKTNYEWNLETPSDEDQKITWSIAKKQLTISDDKKTKALSGPYDGTCVARVKIGTVEGIADSDAGNVTVKASGEFEDKNAGENKEVKVTYSLEDSAKDNYIAPVSDTCTATIHPLEIQVADTEVEDKVYDGNASAKIKKIGEIVLDDPDVKKTVEADDVELDTAAGEFQNVNAGDRGVLVSYTLKGEDAANYFVTDSMVYANIYKAKVNVPEAVTGLIYSGQEQTGVVLPDNALYTLTGNTGTNAKADYEATATLNDKTNYEWNLDESSSEDQKITWKIDRKTINIAAEVKESYVNEPFAELTYKIDESTKLCGNDKLSGALSTGADKSKTGTYDITQGTLTDENNPNYHIVFTKGTYKVADKKVLTDTDFTVEMPSELMYDGSSKAVNVKSKVNGSGDITVRYYKDGKGEGTTEAPKDAGTYTVKIDVTEGSIYAAEKSITNDSWTFTIKQKQLSVSGTAADNKIYDGEASATVNSGEVTGITEADKSDVTVKASGKFNDKNAGTDKDVTVTYTLEGSKAGNYIAPSAEVLKANIAKRKLNVSGTSVESKVYDASIKAEVTAGTLENVVSGDDVAIDTVSGTFRDVDAGTSKEVDVKYTLKGKDKDNYILADETVYADIDRIKVNVPEAIKGLVYNRSEQKGVNEGTGYTVTGNTATMDGEYTATAVLEKNYEWSDGSLEDKEIIWTISKAVVKAPKAIKGLVYSGKKKTGVEKGIGYTVTGNVKTNAGTYKATVKLKEGYCWSDGSIADKKISWSISKAKQPVKIKVISKSVKKAVIGKKKCTIKGALKVTGAKGKVTYTNMKTTSYAYKACKVNKNTGTIQMKKHGCMDFVKTHTLKIKVKASETRNYKSYTKTVYVPIKMVK